LSGSASSHDQNAEFLDVVQIFIENSALPGGTNEALRDRSTFEFTGLRVFSHKPGGMSG
jgi:hypothetical protein